MPRKARKKQRIAEAKLQSLLTQEERIKDILEYENIDIKNQATYIKNYSSFPIHQNTKTKYYKIGEDFYQDLLKDLKQAKHYIFMEYFIVAQGEMWDTILELLKKKVKEGVQVRFMYDDLGCVSLLKPKYYEELRSYGIEAIAVNPFIPLLSVFMNNRDHRKITVIDGYIGYTGGINLADEYINRIIKHGHWKDTAIRLEGDAVWNLTAMFLEMWDTNISNQDHYEDYLPHMYHSQSFETDGYVQPYGDSPLDRETVGENIYLNIINKAKHYIYIYTPYLIIDHEMMTALCLASKSGVDVRIMTPGIPDKKIIFWVSQSYYEPLLKAGVKILEYTPGFIHGKVVLANDEVATVGTVNLDFRSLYLHFECGVYLYQCSSLKEIKKDMLTTFKQGKEITLSFCQNRHWTVRFIQSIARLFAPLL